MSLLHRGAALTAVLAATTGLVSFNAVSDPHSPEAGTFAVQPTAFTNPIDLTAGGDDPGVAVDSTPQWWNDIVDFGQWQITQGMGYLSAGELTSALAMLGPGWANILVYGPQAGLMVAIDDAVGQEAQWQWLPSFYPLSRFDFDNWGDLFAFVQERISNGFDSISQGFDEISAGLTNYGLQDVFWGIDELTVNLGLGLLVGPMAILDL